MVNLTRIYTRTGDAGETRLGDMSDDHQERPAAAGLRRRRRGQRPPRRRARDRRARRRRGRGADHGAERPLRRRRRLLHARRARTRSSRRCASSRTTSTGSRRWCDQYNEDLPKLRSFILNGGTPGGRAPARRPDRDRRAERSAWAAHEQYADTMNVLAITYLNRLSDLLFILARHANREHGDVLWVPGGER